MKSRRSRRRQAASLGGAGPHSGQGLTLLHVDDDANDTELLRAAVRKAQLAIKLQTVDDGEQAIAYLSGSGRYSDRRRFQLPSLVLLDLKMPRATGFDVLKWIRRQPEFASIPVIVFSGSELADDMRAAYESGANSYLIKPLAFEALVNVVKCINSVWLDDRASGTRNCLQKVAERRFKSRTSGLPPNHRDEI